MKRQFVFAAIASGMALMLFPVSLFLKTSASNSIPKPAPDLAQLSDRATVRASGRGAPRINVAEGRELLTSYAGDPEAQRLLQQNLAQPLAIASADFDEDGVPDLLTGYAAPTGGVLTLHRGNVDSIYPNTPEARQRRAAGTFTAAPFLSPARALETPRPADFIACGDFDADGHLDIVIAARGNRALYFFLGDGHGNLIAGRQIDLSGSVTALISGEINRVDGLADIVVGVSGADGPEVLVFEAADGALKADPEVFPLTSEARALVLGQFDDEFPIDLAVAAGRELMIVRGRAQRSQADTKRTNRNRPPAASIERRSFESAIRSLAVGDFTGHHCDDLALLSDDGSVRILSRSAAVSRAKAQKSALLRGWQDEALPGSWPQARLLTSAHVASLPVDNVIIIDSQAHRLQLVANKTATQASRQAGAVSESLDVDSEPVAALPMRLNGDALSDLVILRKGKSAPTVLTSLVAMTYTVDNTGDNGGVDPAPGAATGTLRQAIVDANANAGLDNIHFDIGAVSKTISLINGLPLITDPVNIDGTTQPGFSGNPIIELDGTAVVTDGFSLQGGTTTIRGMVINRFGNNGILVQTIGGNIFERNFIGTSIGGNASAPNLNSGVQIFDSINNRVGGTVAAASNVISGNGSFGVAAGDGTTNTLIQGNRIGTDLNGTSAVGNGAGISLGAEINSTIGGTSASARNIISGNAGSGVILDAGTQGTLVQGNFIGTEITGSSALANVGSGVVISTSSNNNSIGGTSIGAANRIGFNGGSGIANLSGSGNAFLTNSIFSNGSIGIDLIDDAAVTPNDGCDVDVGPNGIQNFPVLTSASSNGANTAIAGSLDSTPSSSFRIEFFSNPTCDGSGFGEGQTFLGATNVTTGPGCGITFNVVLPVGVSPGQVITATATDSGNSTSEFSQCVTVILAACTISCPSDVLASTSPSATTCNTPVSYPLPTTTGTCGSVSCAPPSGSLFNVGSTTVNCSVAGGPSCSFQVSVVDNTPPKITCPTGFTALLPAGQSTAIVNYPAATATDNCTAASVACVPPPGASFPPGTTLVTCAAVDGFQNQNACSFFITVFDAEAPVITCPANVSATLPVGQTSTVVTYPPATATDNRPGVTVVCVPSSGSIFPAGTTTVTCTAIDSDRNSSSCSFVVGVGAPSLQVTIPGGKTAVEFAASPKRKPPKPKNNLCSNFTLANVGFTTLSLTLDSIVRTGSDVNSGRITDPNDSRYFTLSLIIGNLAETPLEIGSVLTLRPGQTQTVCVRFAALIPAPAGKTTGLAAANVLPETVTSNIVFRQIGAGNVSIPILARVATGVVLIDPANPRRAPVVTFTRSGNDITVGYAVFDSNLDVTRAKYEFLDAGGQVVAGPFEVDFAASLSSANLVKGQSFTVEQRFTGATDNPQITGVRVTVFDGETSTVGSSSASSPSIVVLSIQLLNQRRDVTLYPPTLKLNPSLP